MPNKIDDIKLWDIIQSKELFTSKRLNLRQDTCRLPSKRIIDDYLVVEIPDGAAVIAVTEKIEIVLVQQYKHGLGKVVLELPAGNVEKGENPANAVIRELMEETGYIATDVEFVSILVTKPARMSAQSFIYFEQNVRHRSINQESDIEMVETILVPVQELPALIQTGAIITETSLAALLMVWNKLFVY